MFSSRQRQFLSDCRVIFSLPEGKRVLAQLKASYIDTSVYDEDHGQMCYSVGKQDMVIDFLKCADEDEVNQIITSYNYDEGE